MKTANGSRVVCFALTLFASLLIFLPLAHASDFGPPSFANHIDLVRDGNGTLQSVVIHSDAPFSFLNYATKTLNEIEKLQAGGYKVQKFEADTSNSSVSPNVQLQAQDSALKALQSVDVRSIRSNPKIQNALEKLDAKFQANFFGLNVVSQPADPWYFYKSTIENELLKYAESFANLAPGINVVIAIFAQAISDLHSRRSYYQSLVIHNLEQSAPEDLGMSSEEASLVLSSIYESQINWYEIFKQVDAAKNWSAFGNASFQKDVQASSDRIAKFADQYSWVGSGYDYAFFPAAIDHEIVINGRDASSILDHSPSLAFDFDDPTLLRNIRIGYRMIDIGLRFVPIPGIVRSALRQVVDKRYTSQARTEGALFAYFEDMGDENSAGALIDQSVNEFLIMDYSN